MFRRAIAIWLVAVMGCSSPDTTSPTAEQASVGLRATKGGGGNTPGENVQFADLVNLAAPGSEPAWSPAGIRGDGRLKDGVASSGSPSNEYQSQYCGVEAYAGTSGNQTAGYLNIDPDIRWTSAMQPTCGGPRLFHFHLDGLEAAPTPRGPHSLIDFNGLSAGQASNREVRFGVQMTGCAGIRFSDAYPPSVNALVERMPNVVLPGGVSVRQWRVQSRGSHLGSCVVSSKRGFVGTGVSYYLPFSMLVTEVPPSSIVYP